jgi:CBS domain-containing protein
MVLLSIDKQRKEYVTMWNTALVKEWMSHPVVSVEPEMPISKAHQLMKDRGIRRLVVMSDDRLAGIITIGDVREASPSDMTTLSIWELNYLWAQLSVEKVMTRRVRTVGGEASMIDAAALMLEHKISGLPVVDSRNHVIGIITESDIFRMLVKSRSSAPLTADPT